MKIHSKIIAIVFVLCSSILYAQKVSRIYNSKGQLIADTSYSINKLQLKRFVQVEDTLLQQIMAIVRYPEVEREAEIGDSLIVISFTINKNDSLQDLKIEKKMGAGDIGIINDISQHMFNRHNPVVAGYSSKGIGNKKFFLALKFRPKSNIDGPVVKDGLIIERSKPPMIDVTGRKE